MTQDDDELKKIEELLKNQKIHKVPQETLANFSSDVIKHIETETPGIPGWKVVLGIVLIGLLTWVLTDYAIQQRPVPEKALEPSTVTAETGPITETVQITSTVQEQKLTMEEELLLLEEFVDEGVLATQLENLLGEKEYLAEEIELFQTLGFGVRSL